MTAADVERIRDEMERAEARKLQPHFIRAFFLEAFALLGGAVREREPGRFEITHVPAELRRRDRQIGLGAPLLRRYERVTFEKELIAVDGRPLAEYVTPGHPLLDGTIDLIIERYDSLLRQGAVLIDETRRRRRRRSVLVYLQHAVVDGRTDPAGNRRVVSKRFEFVERRPRGHRPQRRLGALPRLSPGDARGARRFCTRSSTADWVRTDLETQALDHGVELARAHLDEVRRRTARPCRPHDRGRAGTAPVGDPALGPSSEPAQGPELAGKLPRSGMNSAKARQRADELAGPPQAAPRRARRRAAARRRCRRSSPAARSSSPPVCSLARRGAPRTTSPTTHANAPSIERAAVDAVMAAERRLGRQPVEMPPNNKGYDIESQGRRRDPAGSSRSRDASPAPRRSPITRSEIGVGRNKPDSHILALVEVDRRPDRHGGPLRARGRSRRSATCPSTRSASTSSGRRTSTGVRCRRDIGKGHRSRAFAGGSG